MLEALASLLIGIALARLSYSLGSTSKNRPNAFPSIVAIVILVILLAIIAHSRLTFSEYARIEVFFIRLGIAALLGFCGFWIYLIVREGEPRIPNVGKTAQSVFKYIAIGMALMLTMLLLYLEPSPLLTRLTRGLSSVEAYGLKLLFQSQPGSITGPKNEDYVNRKLGEQIQSFEPGQDSRNLAHYFLNVLAGNRAKDARLKLEVTGEELRSDNAVRRLMSGVLLPAYGCLLQLDQSGLELNAESLRKLNHLLREEMHTLDQTDQSSPVLRRRVASAVIEFTKALQEQNTHRKPWLEYGLPQGDADRNKGQCEKMSATRLIDVRRKTMRALNAIDPRQGRLHVIGAAMALHDNDRLRALETLDRWILVAVRTGQAQSKASTTSDNVTSAMPAAISYCKSGNWPAAKTARPIVDLDESEVETLLLTCLNIVRVRFLQARILQLYPLNSQQIHWALIELHAGAVELLEGVWQFVANRGEGKDRHSRALKELCYSGQTKNCPDGLMLVKFAELTYKNNVSWFCGLSRHPSEVCSHRAERYCSEVLDSAGADQLARGAIAGSSDPAIVRASFLDTCAQWRLRELADWLDKVQEKPGDYPRKDITAHLKPVREQLRAMLFEINRLRPKIAGPQTSDQSGIASRLQSGKWGSAVVLSGDLEQRRKNLSTAINRIDEYGLD
jgi:hypothetical protein